MPVACRARSTSTPPNPWTTSRPSCCFSAKTQPSEFAGSSPTPKGVLTYIDQFQFGGGDLGVFLGAGYQKLKDRADYLWIDRWYTQATDAGTLYIPRRPRYRSIERETTRKMFNGGVQWKPGEQLDMNLTALYSQDRTANDMNQLVYSFERSPLTVLQTNGLTATQVSASDYWLEKQSPDRTAQSVHPAAHLRLQVEGRCLDAAWRGQ